MSEAKTYDYTREFCAMRCDETRPDSIGLQAPDFVLWRIDGTCPDCGNGYTVLAMVAGRESFPDPVAAIKEVREGSPLFEFKSVSRVSSMKDVRYVREVYSTRVSNQTGFGMSPPAVTSCKPQDETSDVALLEHVSPIEWDDVILYGQDVLDRTQVG
jgi:hypothetical protein